MAIFPSLDYELITTWDIDPCGIDCVVLTGYGTRQYDK